MKRLSILLVLVVFAVSACKPEAGGQPDGVSYLTGGTHLSNEAQAVRSKSSAPSKMALDREKFNNRRIAETHALHVETSPDNMKARYDRDFQKCLDLGCEITSSNVQNRRSGYINARIAPEQLGVYLDFLGSGEGELKEHSVRADDKTLQYIDTDAKIRNLEALKLRLISLMNSDKAKDVDQILKIERELNRVEQQLDSAKGSLRHLETITGMATVNARYSVEYHDLDLKYADLGRSFKIAGQRFIGSVSDVITWTGEILPWLPIWFIVFVLIVKTVRFALGKSGGLLFWRKKKEKSGKDEPKAKKAKAGS